MQHAPYPPRNTPELELQQALNEGPLEFRECWRRLPYSALCGEDTLSTLARCGRMVFDGHLPDNPSQLRDSHAVDTLAQLATQPLPPALALECQAQLTMVDTQAASAALRLALRQRSAPYVFVIYNRLATRLMYAAPRTARGYFWTAHAAALLCDNPLYRERVLPFMQLNNLLDGQALHTPLHLQTHSPFSHNILEICRASENLHRQRPPVPALVAQAKTFAGFAAWQIYLAQQLLKRGEPQKAHTLLLDYYEQHPRHTAKQALLALHQHAPMEPHWCTFFEFDSLRDSLLDALRHALPFFDLNTLARVLRLHKPHTLATPFAHTRRAHL